MRTFLLTRWTAILESESDPHPINRFQSSHAPAQCSARKGREFTGSREIHDKLRQAQDLLRHRVPSGHLAVVFEKALDALIANLMKERFGVGRKPGTDSPGANGATGFVLVLEWQLEAIDARPEVINRLPRGESSRVAVLRVSLAPRPTRARARPRGPVRHNKCEQSSAPGASAWSPRSLRLPAEFLRQNEVLHPERLARYEKSWICLACGHEWVRHHLA
jgi:hypothetical protein